MSATDTLSGKMKIKLSWKSPVDGKVITAVLSYDKKWAATKNNKKRGHIEEEEAPPLRENKKLKLDPGSSKGRNSQVKGISKLKRSSKGVSCRQIKQIAAARLKSTLSNDNVTKTKENAAGSDGQVEQLCHTIKPSTPPLFSVPLSPRKALCAARNRLRFAHTFLKTQGKVGTNDPLKFQQEKAIFEQEQRQEIARLEAILGREGDREAHIAPEKVEKPEETAAESIALEKVKKPELTADEHREKDRAEARIALEKVERTVIFEDNLYILGELKKLSGYYDSSWGPYFRSPLDRLGLYLKDDSTQEVDKLEEGGDELEEGEIV